MGGALAAQERTRESIDVKYKWNLADLYASDAAWRTEKDALAATFGQAKAFAGTLGQSAVAAGQGAVDAVGAGKDAGAAVRLRQPVGRPGHARVQPTRA